MIKEDLVRVFVKGGIISPGDLLKIISVAERLGADAIHLGSRQDILFPVREKSKEILDETFHAIYTQYEINTFEYQNISSSFVAKVWCPYLQATSIFWLRTRRISGMYIYASGRSCRFPGSYRYWCMARTFRVWPKPLKKCIL